MGVRKTKIEFLPQECWEKGAWGKILKWALTIGRHIVIFTEFVVILAFLSRFKLDRDLTDLGERIKQQQAIVSSWSSFEKEFRFLSKRLQTISELRENRLEADIVLEELASLIPKDVVVHNLDVSGGQLSLTAFALSDSGASSFLRSLRGSGMFKNISLSQLNLEPEKEIGVKFQIKGELSGK